MQKQRGSAGKENIMKLVIKRTETGRYAMPLLKLEMYSDVVKIGYELKTVEEMREIARRAMAETPTKDKKVYGIRVNRTTLLKDYYEPWVKERKVLPDWEERLEELE